MIRPLRERHRRLTLVLAIAAPTGFVLGLVARNPPPAGVSASRGPSTPLEAPSSARRLEGLPILAHMERGRAAPSLLLRPEIDLREPDVLVYLTRAHPPLDVLPGDAHLLGSLAGRKWRLFELPADAGPEAASIVLYSLGHQELLGSSRLLPD